MAQQYNHSVIRKALLKKGYRWLDSGPYHLNMVAVRRNTAIANAFDDVFTVSHFDGQAWRYAEWKCTTDPGLYWLLNPMNVKGTAILPLGQYLDCWRIGMHQGAYEALVQCQPVTVWRDSDRDNRLDYGGTAPTDTGIFGINIHRANALRESVQVDKWSAGCTVIANPNNFAALMVLAKESARLGRASFSYTLLGEADV